VLQKLLVAAQQERSTAKLFAKGSLKIYFLFSIWRSQVEEGNHGKIVAIDIGAY